MNFKNYFSNLYTAIKGGKSQAKIYKKQIIEDIIKDVEKAALKGVELELDRGMDIGAYVALVAKEYYLKSVTEFNSLTTLEIAEAMQSAKDKLADSSIKSEEKKLRDSENDWDEASLEELKKEGKLVAFRIPDKKGNN